MLIDRPWRVAVPLLALAAYVVPAAAQQQPESAAPASAAPAVPGKPLKPKLKPKHRPVVTPGAAATATPPVPAIGGSKPTLLGQYGEWGAYTASPGGKKVCFALAKPASEVTAPPNRPRNPVYMFISSRPTEKVSDEVSIVIGYPFKPGSDASVDIAGNSFALYTQQDGAWIKNAADEAHMIDAMREGQSAVVKGVSAKGTQSTDTYSLRGLTQALERTGQDCK